MHSRYRTIDSRGRFASSMSESERFWSQVAKNGPIPEHKPELGPCWIWTGAVDEAGYGKFKRKNRKTGGAHRFSYEDKKGRIPRGKPLDHLCSNPPCVNFNHLEPVTIRENIMRSRNFVAVNAKKSVCFRGHELTKNNCYPSHLRRGERQCRACDRLKYRLRVRIVKARECGLLRS